jgi:hypothetical protein
VLGWATRPDRDTPADLVLGQPDFTAAAELPYGDASDLPAATEHGATHDRRDNAAPAHHVATGRAGGADRFPGGSIGHLAVHGTVNDLAVSGAVPRWLSVAFVIEEGFAVGQLREIVADMAAATTRSAGTPA